MMDIKTEGASSDAFPFRETVTQLNFDPYSSNVGVSQAKTPSAFESCNRPGQTAQEAVINFYPSPKAQDHLPGGQQEGFPSEVPDGSSKEGSPLKQPGHMLQESNETEEPAPCPEVSASKMKKKFTRFLTKHSKEFQEIEQDLSEIYNLIGTETYCQQANPLAQQLNSGRIKTERRHPYMMKNPLCKIQDDSTLMSAFKHQGGSALYDVQSKGELSVNQEPRAVKISDRSSLLSQKCISEEFYSAHISKKQSIQPSILYRNKPQPRASLFQRAPPQVGYNGLEVLKSHRSHMQQHLNSFNRAGSQSHHRSVCLNSKKESMYQSGLRTCRDGAKLNNQVKSASALISPPKTVEDGHPRSENSGKSRRSRSDGPLHRSSHASEEHELAPADPSSELLAEPAQGEDDVSQDLKKHKKIKGRIKEIGDLIGVGQPINIGQLFNNSSNFLPHLQLAKGAGISGAMTSRSPSKCHAKPMKLHFRQQPEQRGRTVFQQTNLSLLSNHGNLKVVRMNSARETKARGYGFSNRTLGVLGYQPQAGVIHEEDQKGSKTQRDAAFHTFSSAPNLTDERAFYLLATIQDQIGRVIGKVQAQKRAANKKLKKLKREDCTADDATSRAAPPLNFESMKPSLQQFSKGNRHGDLRLNNFLGNDQSFMNESIDVLPGHALPGHGLTNIVLPQQAFEAKPVGNEQFMNILQNNVDQLSPVMPNGSLEIMAPPPQQLGPRGQLGNQGQLGLHESGKNPTAVKVPILNLKKINPHHTKKPSSLEIYTSAPSNSKNRHPTLFEVQQAIPSHDVIQSDEDAMQVPMLPSAQPFSDFQMTDNQEGEVMADPEYIGQGITAITLTDDFNANGGGSPIHALVSDDPTNQFTKDEVDEQDNSCPAFQANGLRSSSFFPGGAPPENVNDSFKNETTVPFANNDQTLNSPNNEAFQLLHHFKDFGSGEAAQKKFEPNSDLKTKQSIKKQSGLTFQPTHQDHKTQRVSNSKFDLGQQRGSSNRGRSRPRQQESDQRISEPLSTKSPLNHQTYKSECRRSEAKSSQTLKTQKSKFRSNPNLPLAHQMKQALQKGQQQSGGGSLKRKKQTSCERLPKKGSIGLLKKQESLKERALTVNVSPMLKRKQAQAMNAGDKATSPRKQGVRGSHPRLRNGSSKQRSQQLKLRRIISTEERALASGRIQSKESKESREKVPIMTQEGSDDQIREDTLPQLKVQIHEEHSSIHFLKLENEEGEETARGGGYPDELALINSEFEKIETVRDIRNCIESKFDFFHPPKTQRGGDSSRLKDHFGLINSKTIDYDTQKFFKQAPLEENHDEEAKGFKTNNGGGPQFKGLHSKEQIEEQKRVNQLLMNYPLEPKDILKEGAPLAATASLQFLKKISPMATEGGPATSRASNKKSQLSKRIVDEVSQKNFVNKKQRLLQIKHQRGLEQNPEVPRSDLLPPPKSARELKQDGARSKPGLEVASNKLQSAKSIESIQTSKTKMAASSSQNSHAKKSVSKTRDASLRKEASLSRPASCKNIVSQRGSSSIFKSTGKQRNATNSKPRPQKLQAKHEGEMVSAPISPAENAKQLLHLAQIAQSAPSTRVPPGTARPSKTKCLATFKIAQIKKDLPPRKVSPIEKAAETHALLNRDLQSQCQSLRDIQTLKSGGMLGQFPEPITKLKLKIHPSAPRTSDPSKAKQSPQSRPPKIVKVKKGGAATLRQAIDGKATSMIKPLNFKNLNLAGYGSAAEASPAGSQARILTFRKPQAAPEETAMTEEPRRQQIAAGPYSFQDPSGEDRTGDKENHQDNLLSLCRLYENAKVQEAPFPEPSTGKRLEGRSDDYLTQVPVPKKKMTGTPVIKTVRLKKPASQR